MLEKSSEILVSNIVPKDKMREFQKATLNVIAEALLNSFGPFGSNAVLQKQASLTEYTKDGHKILCDIKFNDAIEATTRKDLEDITRHIVKKVGDGTTSSILLSSIIFDKLDKLEELYTPYELVSTLKKGMKALSEKIMEKKKDFTPEVAYEIAYIATNGNEEISSYIKDIYDKFGDNVFVDVSISNDTTHYLKEYDGMTLDVGFSDVAYINNKEKGISSIRKAKIYAFEDPIDTPEMASFFDLIIKENIYNPIAAEEPAVPTVVLAPKMSRDMSAFMEQLVSQMYNVKVDAHKPPFLFITNIFNEDQFADICRMCGCKGIRKYINLDQQQADMAAGLAPTQETIHEFAGSAELVEADDTKTKFVRPGAMFTKLYFKLDENGNEVEVEHRDYLKGLMKGETGFIEKEIYSEEFNILQSYLKTELSKAEKDSQDANVTGRFKRRLNSLNSNLVEILIGGISVSDRDSLRDLVEDAVLNCRSAAQNGIGYGANFEGFRASAELIEEEPDNEVYKTIHGAYKELVYTLLSTGIKDEEKKQTIMNSLLLHNKPYNLKTGQFSDDVKCSIMSDIVIGEAVADIVSLMFTSNQFICSEVSYNRYLHL